jgi:pyruvate formate lyase activating enzyme
MRVGGIQKMSLVDYPGRTSAVIFTQGCNYACPYCHNQALIPVESETPNILWEEVMVFLRRRIGLLTGVVFCGGEPTLHDDLMARVQEVKALGFAVKLDTNGSHPERLAELLPHLDFVAMDLKSSFGDPYDKACGTAVDQEAVKQSMALLRASKVPYMFRTTTAAGTVSEADSEAIHAMLLPGEEYRVTKAEAVRHRM